MPYSFSKVLKKKYVIAIVLIVVILSIAPSSAISLSSTKFMESIPAGDSKQYDMTIGIGQNEKPVDMTISVMGFGQALDKGYMSISPSNDLSPYSARSFISLSSQTLHLTPGTQQTVTATISLPKNVGEGGRYALIEIYQVPEKGQLVTTKITVPVIITVSGTNPTLTGTITGISVADVVAGQPLSVTTTLKNTGNYHYYGTVDQIKIADANGIILANSSTSPSTEAIIPGSTVQFVEELNVKSLPVGSYKVSSKVLTSDGKILDDKTITYEVKETYVAPPDQAGITVNPGSESTLQTPDGRYSVIFPRGSVFSAVDVSLKGYSYNQLQPAPQGAKLGTSSFEITGLSGLLSKDATVKVKYSADDLTAAGGDASKLKLSYYDAANSAWVILPTTVDAQAMILSTTTNHLSVWAVMVSSSTTGSPASASAPVATTAQGSPPPLTVILISLAIAVLAAGYHTGKRK